MRPAPPKAYLAGDTTRPSVIAVFGGRVFFGQERANVEVLSALKDVGCEVTILMRNEKWPEVTAFRDKFHSLGFEVVQQPFADPLLLRHSWRTIWKTIAGLFAPSVTLWKLIAQRPQSVIYLFNTYYGLTILCYLLVIQTPVVYRAGDVPPTHNWFRRMLWGAIRRRVVRAVAVSDYIKGELIALGLPDEKISVIYSRPRLRSAELPPPGGSSDLPTVVYVGQLTEEKGIGILAEAFERLAQDHPCRLVMVGRIDAEWKGDAYARAVRDRLTQSSFADQVEFPGFVDDVYIYLRNAQVHVQPSVWNEPLANTVMEAKLAAVPSVIFSSGGLPEVVRDGVDGTICAEKTAASLADALRPYLEDPGLAERRGLAAKESLTNLGADRFEKSWLALIQEAAN